MSWRQAMQRAGLLLLLGVPLWAPVLKATSFGGWPAVGVAAALFLLARRRAVWLVALAELAVVGVALALHYDVAPWAGLLGGLAVVLPALLTGHLLTRGWTQAFRLEEADSMRYHAVTAAAALLCAVLSSAAVAAALDPADAALTGLMAFLASLTAQLVVLPLLVPRHGRPAAGSALELGVQRVLLAGVTVVVFWPDLHLATAFLVFPVLGWAAIRATRLEAHVQLFAVSTAAYALTVYGHGPLSGNLRGVPDALGPALLYLFVAAACYLIVPLTLNVDRLFSMTGQATRAATTIERLLDSASGTVIIATDELGRITHFNAGAQQLLGYPPEEVLGRTPAMFHSPEEITRHAQHLGVPEDHTQVVLAMVGRGERRDWEFVQRDGSRRMISLSLTEVTEADGRVVGYIGAGEDITERLRVQGTLLAALEREHASVLRLEEVDHVKQELVSNVSHELRTPITSISGYAELLGDGALGELNPEQEDAVHRIERNTTRLGLLVEDLLTLARAESGRLELERVELDLRTVLDDARELLDELLRGRSLELLLDITTEPVPVLGDPRALERVVMNLLSNAVKFTPDGGQVSVSVHRVAEGGALVVGDTGMGISTADQEQLFSRFFRSAAATEQAIQGTGLGLSIVHAIVTQHGGTATVDSAPGRGTTVRVVLPLVRH